jgi:membrane protease YdiL (CAAX protease family)
VWTVRQVDPFLPVGLSTLYDRLNLVDPNASGADRWGGSDDIGGSPRRSGTGLDLRQITGVCRWVYRPPGVGERVRAVVVSSVVGLVAVAAAAGLAVLSASSARLGTGLVPSLGVRGSAVFAVALAFAALVLMVSRGRSTPRLVGLRRPQGAAWAWLGVPMAVAAAAGGAWIATPTTSVAAFGSAGTPAWWAAGVVMLAAGAAELVFRGFVHGGIARVFRIMTPGGERFVSIPVLVAAVLSTTATVSLLASSPFVRSLPSVAANATWVGGALLAGVVAGVVRERSGSVWAAALLHGVVAVIAWSAFVAWG